MRYVHHIDIDRFVQYAVRVWDVSLPLNDKEGVVEAAIGRLEDFYRSLGLPVRLSEAGIGGEKLREMAENTMLGGWTYQGNSWSLASTTSRKYSNSPFEDHAVWFGAFGIPEGAFC